MASVYESTCEVWVLCGQPHLEPRLATTDTDELAVRVYGLQPPLLLGEYVRIISPCPSLPAAARNWRCELAHNQTETSDVLICYRTVGLTYLWMSSSLRSSFRMASMAVSVVKTLGMVADVPICPIRTIFPLSSPRPPPIIMS